MKPFGVSQHITMLSIQVQSDTNNAVQQTPFMSLQSDLTGISGVAVNNGGPTHVPSGRRYQWISGGTIIGSGAAKSA